MESAETKEEGKSIHIRTHSHSGTDIWPTIKPFVNGFLTGQLSCLQFCVSHLYYRFTVHRAQTILGPDAYSVLQGKRLLIEHTKSLRSLMRFQAPYSTALFGTFESLSKRATEANGGSPITLYQEACCGLIAGATTATISYPFQAWESRKTHSVHCPIRKAGFLTLWHGARPYVARHAAINMGMLVSYGRSLKYFEESVGVTQAKAQIGAGIASAFFATICNKSWDLMVRQPGGSIGHDFLTFTHILVQWMVLEHLRKIEE